jgi:hypothetical protein
MSVHVICRQNRNRVFCRLHRELGFGVWGGIADERPEWLRRAGFASHNPNRCEPRRVLSKQPTGSRAMRVTIAPFGRNL